MDISAEVAAIQAASQGSELRQPLVGALNKLNSGSLPAVTASDVGKILKVGANGWEVGEKSGYMPIPVASLNVSSNGTHDVTNYSEAVVNVQPSGTITITQNGTDIDVADYALANVAVSGGGTLVQKTITQNGTYNPADDSADGYSRVTVNVMSGDNLVDIFGNPTADTGTGYEITTDRNPYNNSFRYQAFRQTGVWGSSTNARPAWIKYTFTDGEKRIIKLLQFMNYINALGGGFSAAAFQLQGSNDDFATFDVLYDFSGGQATEDVQRVPIHGNGAYSSFRFYITEITSNNRSPGLNRICAYGYIDTDS